MLWIATASAFAAFGALLTSPLPGPDPAARGDGEAVTRGDARLSAEAPESAPPASPAEQPARQSRPARPAGESPEPTGKDDIAGGPAEGEALVPVDLAALRARMPENLYWELGAPTEDPEIQARRAAEEERMNTLFGKVQSGAASGEEIERYHERRRRISEDYVAFATAVLTEHGADLSDRDRGLLELSVRMHRARLAELPRRLHEAHERKRQQDLRRAEWRAASAGHPLSERP